MRSIREISVYPIVLTTLLFAGSSSAFTFTEVPTAIPGVRSGTLRWVDFDRDGDLDLFLMGYPLEGDAFTRLYRNDDGLFVDVDAGLWGLGLGDADWADIDSDGDLDLAYAGVPFSDIVATKLYRNDSGVFTELDAGLLPSYAGSVRFYDPDQDGDADLLVTGSGGAALYLNRDGIFTLRRSDAVGTTSGEVLVDDFSADGVADIVRIGVRDGEAGSPLEFVADRGKLDLHTTPHFDLPGRDLASLDWGDFDQDGDLDLAAQGRDESGLRWTRIWSQNYPMFTDIPLSNLADGDLAWGDADNDGDLDLVAGGGGIIGISFTILYENVDGDFVFDQELVKLSDSSFAWGDYDGDGDLDLAVTGKQMNTEPIFKLYRNDTFLLNNPPSPPTGLAVDASAHALQLTWQPGSDFETPAAGLTYNLWVGSAPGAGDILDPAAAADGRRYLTGLGNGANAKILHLKPANLEGGFLHWGVQAVDAAGGASAFASGPVAFLPFSEVFDTLTLAGWRNAYVAWGDYDDDGLQEPVVSGEKGMMDFDSTKEIYPDPTNPAANYLDEYTGLMRWGDFDNDNDLDLLQALWLSELPPRLYRNDGGTFSLVLGTGLPGDARVELEWADMDRDGDLDAVIPAQGIYLNDGGGFGLMPGSPTCQGYAESADFDRDGDLDILMGGIFAGDIIEHRILRNDGGVWQDISGGLPGEYPALGSFIDHDGDGDLDVIVASETVAPAVYRNDDGVFVRDEGASLGLPLIATGDILPADVDQDGDQDLLFTGFLEVGFETILMQNDGGVFSEAPVGLPYLGDVGAYGDFDGDHDLDLFLLGRDRVGTAGSGLFRNNYDNNTPPVAPGDLSASVAGDILSLSWSAGRDFQTPALQLSYNVRVGTTPNGSQITSAMAHADGTRKLSAPGNAGGALFYTLDLTRIEADAVYWTVQAIDGAYAGSPFAPEQMTSLNSSAVPAPVAVAGITSIAPNPAATRTAVAFTLPRAAEARVRIFDLRGRRVRTLRAGQIAAGPHQLSWDGRDEFGRDVGSGTYFLRLEAGDLVETRKVVMQR